MTVSPLDWLSVPLGILIVVGTSVSVIKTLIVPRRAWSLIPHAVESLVTRVFMSIARRVRTYDMVDRWLGFFGPMVLITTLLVWLTMYVLGFALMLVPSADNFAAAVGQSGASTFTLGITGAAAGSGTAVSVAASAAGLIVIALTIAYLPALYAVIRRRETLTRQLGVHAGSPQWGPNVVLEYHRAGALEALPALYLDWDRWANEVADGHTKYPILSQFRLPRSKYHWLLSLLAALDAAGLDLSLRPSVSAGEARLFLLSGTACVDDLAASLRMAEGLDASGMVTQPEFTAAVSLLTDAGYPAERSSEDAWLPFLEWREHYHSAIFVLLDTIVAPPAPWSGKRSIPAKGRSDQATAAPV